MTSSNLQHLEKPDDFSYIRYEIPPMTRENDAKGLEAHMQLLGSMLTAAATGPRSADHSMQINALLQQSAIQQALKTIIVECTWSSSTNCYHECLHVTC